MEIFEDKKPMALYQFALQALKMNRFAAYIVIGDMVVVSFYSCLHSFVHFLVLTFLAVCPFAERYELSWLPATGVKMMANLNSFVFCYPLVSTVKFPTAFYSSINKTPKQMIINAVSLATILCAHIVSLLFPLNDLSHVVSTLVHK